MLAHLSAPSNVAKKNNLPDQAESEISIDQWRAALGMAHAMDTIPANALTMHELAAKLELARSSCAAWVKKGIEAGTIKVYRKCMLDHAGKKQYIPVYVVQR